MKKTFSFVSALLVVVLVILGYMNGEDVHVDREPVIMSAYEGEGKEYIDVVFLDVGQGDATFIEMHDGTQMLVDCAIDARILESLGLVMPFYDHTLDYLVITHPDFDHYGGCEEVLERFEVENIVYSGVGKEQNKSWVSLAEAIGGENATMHVLSEQEVWQFGSTTIDFLYPDHSLEQDPNVPGEGTFNSNDTSIVMKISVGEQDILLTGDGEEDLEAYLVDTYGQRLDVEVLKVGHHGSGSSSIEPFLDVVTPEHAVISSGAGNRYGHPSRRVLKRLERVGSEVWRTDTQKNIFMKVFVDRVEVESR